MKKVLRFFSLFLLFGIICTFVGCKKPTEEEVKYNVVFQYEDGTVYKSFTVINTEQINVDAPAKTGHTFAGWKYGSTEYTSAQLESAINNTIYCTVKKRERLYGATETLYFGPAGSSNTQATFRLNLYSVDQNNMPIDRISAITLGEKAIVVPELYNYNNV